MYTIPSGGYPLSAHPHLTLFTFLRSPQVPPLKGCFRELLWQEDRPSAFFEPTRYGRPHEGDDGLMGIKFLNLTDEQKTMLKTFLARIDSFYSD